MESVAPVDASEPSDVDRGVKRAVDTFGGIETLFNSTASPYPFGPFAGSTFKQWNGAPRGELVMGCGGLAFPDQAWRRRPDQHHLLLPTSRDAAGRVGRPRAAKTGVAASARMFPAEGGADDIRSNSISPIAIFTPPSANLRSADKAVGKILISKMRAGRLGGTEEVASVAVFQASNQAIYANAQDIVVDCWVLGANTIPQI